MAQGGVNGFGGGLVVWGWVRWILGKPLEVKWQVSARGGLRDVRGEGLVPTDAALEPISLIMLASPRSVNSANGLRAMNELQNDFQ